jgi:hypothetical protein
MPASASPASNGCTRARSRPLATDANAVEVIPFEDQTAPVRGMIAEGHTRLADYVDVQPYPTGPYAEALLSGRRAAG